MVFHGNFVLCVCIVASFSLAMADRTREIVKTLCNCWFPHSVEMNQTCIYVEIRQNCSREAIQYFEKVEYDFSIVHNSDIVHTKKMCSLSEKQCVIPCITSQLQTGTKSDYLAWIFPICQYCDSCMSFTIPVKVHNIPRGQIPDHTTQKTTSSVFNQQGVIICMVGTIMLLAMVVTCYFYLHKNKQRRFTEQTMQLIDEEVGGPGFERIFIITTLPDSFCIPKSNRAILEAFIKATTEQCACTLKYVSHLEMNPLYETEKLFSWCQCALVILNKDLCQIWLSDSKLLQTPYQLATNFILRKIQRNLQTSQERPIFFVNFSKHTSPIDKLKSKLHLDIPNIYSIFNFSNENIAFTKLKSHFKTK